MTPPQYILTETASSELDEILSWIADHDGKGRALHVYGKFEDAFKHLASHPQTGTTRPNLTGEHLRWWPVFKWIVIYDPNLPISILRILYGGRNIDSLIRSGESS